MTETYTLDELLVEFAPHLGDEEYLKALPTTVRADRLIPIEADDVFNRKLQYEMNKLADRHGVSLEYLVGLGYGLLLKEDEYGC